MNKKLSNIKPFVAAKSEYVDFYQRTLPEPRMVKDILEIGFNLESLEALAKVFPEALIHTMDFFDDKSTMSSEAIEEKGFFVYNMMGKNNNPKALSSISSQFDLIIDRGSHPLTKLPIFIHLFQENVTSRGFYYIEDLQAKSSKSINARTNKTESVTGENLQNVVKAICDCNRDYAGKMVSRDNINKIIDLVEYSDTDQSGDIACFRKMKIEKKVKPVKAAKSTQQDKPEKESSEAQIIPPPPLNIPSVLKFKILGDQMIEIETPAPYGPVRKDILISYLGRPHEIPEIFGIYGSNPDFYFRELDPKSDQYRLEIARSYFTICNNDRAIIEALVNGTIPVIMQDGDAKKFDNPEWAVACMAHDLQSVIGSLYMNRALLNTFVSNGKILLKHFGK